jgi:hypothetical protein
MCAVDLVLHFEKPEPARVRAGQIIEVCLVQIGARLLPVFCRPVPIFEGPAAIGQRPAAINQRHRAVIGGHRAIGRRDGTIIRSRGAVLSSASPIFSCARAQLRSGFPEGRNRGIGHLAIVKCLASFRRSVKLVGRSIAGEGSYIAQARGLVTLERIRRTVKRGSDARIPGCRAISLLSARHVNELRSRVSRNVAIVPARRSPVPRRRPLISLSGLLISTSGHLIGIRRRRGSICMGLVVTWIHPHPVLGSPPRQIPRSGRFDSGVSFTRRLPNGPA